MLWLRLARGEVRKCVEIPRRGLGQKALCPGTKWEQDLAFPPAGTSVLSGAPWVPLRGSGCVLRGLHAEAWLHWLDSKGLLTVAFRMRNNS